VPPRPSSASNDECDLRFHESPLTSRGQARQLQALRTPVGRGRQRPASPWGETEVLKRLSVAGYELKLTLAVPQPTCWIQTFWIPSMSGARSWSATITFTFLKEASFPSPAR
jgi:hypothetical protein